MNKMKNNHKNKYHHNYHSKQNDSNKQDLGQIFPTLAELKEYELLFEGASKVIFDLIEQEQLQRHLIELQELNIQKTAIRRGQIGGIIFSSLTLIMVTLLSIIGLSKMAMTLIIAATSGFTIANICSIFSNKN